MELEEGVTAREVQVRYQFLARQLHPDKHDTEETGMTSEEAEESRDYCNSGGTEENSRSPPSPPPPMTPPNRSRSNNFPHSLPRNRNINYDERGVGINIRDSLGVMELEAGVTAREVQVRYRFLARQLHPEKHETEETGMTS